MKKLLKISLLATIMVFLLIGQAIAVKPGNTLNPNGFPSGEHFNLNILGKGSTFTCPEQESYYLRIDTCNCGLHNKGDLVEECPDGDICVVTGFPIGNVIFVPENTQEDVRIYMQSGKKGGGGRNLELPNILVVLDACAGFVGPEDTALLQLPSNVDSYDVYARPLATPKEQGEPPEPPSMTVVPALYAAEDENETPLYFLGQVGPDGFYQQDGTFVRKKGQSVAVDITGLFMWSGTIFYLDPLDIPEGEEGNYSECQVCAVDDAPPPPDGPDGTPDWYYKASYDGTTYSCPDGGTLTTAYCREYTEDVWIFSIADFVTYLWGLDNDGLRHLQVRFYPVGKDADTAPPRQNTLATQWGNMKSK